MTTELGRVLELLMSGHFICQTTDEHAYRYLSSLENQQLVDQQLGIFNRKLSAAANEEVFYASYIELGEQEQNHITHQFQEINQHLMPLVEWLLMVQEAMGTDIPLTQSSLIRLNEIQTTIEDTPAYTEQLSKISRYSLFGSKANDVDAQLKLIFKRLIELGYLIKPNQNKQIYKATGKIDYLFEVLKFINEAEGLNLVERAEDAIGQSSLL